MQIMNNEKMNQMIDEAYENYLEKMVYHPEENWLDDGDGKKNYRQLKKQEFINKCKTDSEFSERWVLKIEERELSNDERFRIAYKDLELRKKLEAQSKMLRYPDGHNEVMDDANIQTKLITITYNNETIESYE